MLHIVNPKHQTVGRRLLHTRELGGKDSVNLSGPHRFSARSNARDASPSSWAAASTMMVHSVHLATAARGTLRQAVKHSSLRIRSAESAS